MENKNLPAFPFVVSNSERGVLVNTFNDGFSKYEIVLKDFAIHLIEPMIFVPSNYFIDADSEEYIKRIQLMMDRAKKLTDAYFETLNEVK